MRALDFYTWYQYTVGLAVVFRATMIHCLYKSTNTINGRFYIGVHSTDDVGFGTDTWTDPYVGSGKLVQRALKKYGRGAFRVEALASFDTADEAYRAEAEMVTAAWLIEHRGTTYNITGGGTGGNLVTHNPLKNPSTAARVGLASKIYHTGRSLPLPTRLKIQSTLLEQRDAIAAKTKADPPSKRPEVARKIARALKGRPSPAKLPDARRKMSEDAARRVCCVKCHKEGAYGPMRSRHFPKCHIIAG